MLKPAVSETNNKKKKFFERFANKITTWTGSPFAFGSAAIIVIIWGVSGPLFDFSETWQLVINRNYNYYFSNGLSNTEISK